MNVFTGHKSALRNSKVLLMCLSSFACFSMFHVAWQVFLAVSLALTKFSFIFLLGKQSCWFSGSQPKCIKWHSLLLCRKGLTFLFCVAVGIFECWSWSTVSAFVLQDSSKSFYSSSTTRKLHNLYKNWHSLFFPCTLQMVFTHQPYKHTIHTKRSKRRHLERENDEALHLWSTIPFSPLLLTIIFNPLASNFEWVKRYTA